MQTFDISNDSHLCNENWFNFQFQWPPQRKEIQHRVESSWRMWNIFSVVWKRWDLTSFEKLSLSAHRSHPHTIHLFLCVLFSHLHPHSTPSNSLTIISFSISNVSDLSSNSFHENWIDKRGEEQCRSRSCFQKFIFHMCIVESPSSQFRVIWEWEGGKRQWKEVSDVGWPVLALYDRKFCKNI